MTRRERNLIPDFMDGLISQIKRDIKSSVVASKFIVREQDVLNASWIRWKIKPRHIRMKSLMLYVTSNLEWVQRRNNQFVIQINKLAKIPNSYTSIDTLARFLDKGNNVTPGTYFISKVLAKYRENINDYWKAYVSIKLKEVRVDECISIR